MLQHNNPAARRKEVDTYSPRVSYALVYRGNKGPIDSKRWEAWRQGIADYEYLRMLSDAVTAAAKTGKPDDAIDRARRILAGGVGEVVGRSPHGGDAHGAAAADRCRLSILECLGELARPTNSPSP
jgi:hypothetical protein